MQIYTLRTGENFDPHKIRQGVSAQFREIRIERQAVNDLLRMASLLMTLANLFP